VRVSSRLPCPDTNALTRALRDRRARGDAVIDLTVSNPTRVGLPYPSTLTAALGDPAALVYEPAPLGLEAARAAIAADYQRRGAAVGADQVVLTASSSEAYSWLFKLLCDPGAGVLVPRPSYPLLDHLTRLEGIDAVPYDLRYDGRWEIDMATVVAAPSGPRALVAVSPNNPTGSYLSAAEFARLVGLCAARGWALIVDEVFADYSLDDGEWPTDQGVVSAATLTFTLGGCSKTLGLPQFKLGWIVVSGPAPERREALAALEFIADAYLSVNVPVQHAAGALLDAAAPVRNAIHARIRATLSTVQAAVNQYSACDLLRVEGGWSAAVRVPATGGEQQLVLAALEHDGVLVHPGYYFDFPHEAFVVVSLLVEPATMHAGLTRVLARAAA
jgi:alanine-synthesizing transaminase